ncbi:MAG: glycosyl hydrolase 53 family protein, partial [Bacteroidetes bacterium]|nr:glycosyl hydrolase 53 family protein [Bacteroidota bacterium]
MGAHDRLEKIPGREFLDFNGNKVDAIKFFAGNGFNAMRVFASYSDPVILTTGPVDNTNADYRERNFQLDFGGIDTQVILAKRAKAAGMKILVTIQFGQDGPVDNWHEYFPTKWLNLTYQQMLDSIDKYTRVVLKPFLNAGIQPDVIIVENEADSGMLFQYLGTDGKMHIRDNVATDVFSDVATGIYSIWPKSAGFFKRVILSAKDEISKAGLDPAYTRIAVHTTCNPFRARSTFDRIFNNKPDAEQVFYQNGTSQGIVTAVPANIRNLNLRDMVDIMGFSYYPPLPTTSTQADFDKSNLQLTDDMNYMDPLIKNYGIYTSGPFIGQYKKQALVVEYAAGTDASIGCDEARQKLFVADFFKKLSSYGSTMGALWWEPTYGNNNWYHDEGSLYRHTVWNSTTNTWAKLRPLDLIKTWAACVTPISTSLEATPQKDAASLSLSPNPVTNGFLSIKLSG